jgi:hypothetical protein
VPHLHNDSPYDVDDDEALVVVDDDDDGDRMA